METLYWDSKDGVWTCGNCAEYFQPKEVSPTFDYRLAQNHKTFIGGTCKVCGVKWGQCNMGKEI